MEKAIEQRGFVGSLRQFWREQVFQFLLGFAFFRHFFDYSFWKTFRNECCRIIKIEHYTVADRDQVLIVTSQVERGFQAGRKWRLVAHYDPTYDAAGKQAALEVQRQIRDLSERGNVEIITAQFHYWSGFFDYLERYHSDLTMIDPSQRNFLFAVLW